MSHFGIHTSIKKGFLKAAEKARTLGCECFQCFTSSPLGRGEKELEEEEIQEFQKFVKKYFGLEHFYLHTPYYINLASLNSKVWHTSIATIIKAMIKAKKLGGKYVITHVGSHMGKGSEKGIRRMQEALKLIFKDSPKEVILLLENTSGAGTELGSNFEELSEIIQNPKSKIQNLGVCLDTAHTFEAGYNLRDKKAVNETLGKFDKIIGLKYLYLCHANDSKTDLGSRIDRHEHIGKGKIGLKGFKALLNDKRLENLDFIIETPKKDDKDDIRNLKILKSLIIH